MTLRFSEPFQWLSTNARERSDALAARRITLLKQGENERKLWRTLARL